VSANSASSSSAASLLAPYSVRAPGSREVLGDAQRRGAGERLLVDELEARVRLAEGQALLRGDRIDAARREEGHLRAMSRSEVEAVVGAHEVGLHHELTGALEPGHHRALC
jgi:hypothetical protein